MKARAPASRLLALALAACTAACASTTLPPYPVRAANDYATAQAVGDLVVAVEPLLDPGESERAFGFDLLRDQQVLAVLLVVENRGDRRSFLVPADAVEAQLASEHAPDPSQGAAKKHLASLAAATALNVGAIFFPPLILASMTLTNATGTRVTESAVSRHVLLTTAWRSHTISPGQRESGLVYFPLAELPKDATSIELVVAARDVFTHEESRFSFDVPVPAERQ